MGGLLTLDAFVRAFPQMDTLHTKGQEQLYNSQIQGTLPNPFAPRRFVPASGGCVRKFGHEEVY